MDYFRYRRGELYCEEVKVKDIVSKFKTPLYIYSKRTIVEHFLKLKNAFREIKPLICYSVKANSNLSILKILIRLGAGLDIVSGGELYRAKMVKAKASKIVYASVGKTEAEIRQALRYGILFFNAESLSELHRLNRIAYLEKKKARVSLRLNIDVEPGASHAYISTGKSTTKFGIELFKAKDFLLNRRGDYPYLDIVGLHIHIGSQLIRSQPFIQAIKKVLIFLKSLGNIKLKYLDIGGGLGIVYNRERPQTASGFAKKVLPLLKKSKLKIILQPGRFIVGNAGILVTEILYIKQTPKKTFVIVDAGMNDLIRPALYGAYHNIVPLKKQKVPGKRVSGKVDVVGPVCESGDFLGKDRTLYVREGEYLAVLSAGAYAFSMASNYNSRLRPAEVLVDRDRVILIRRRETWRDLTSREILI